MSALESKAISAPARSRRFFEMLPTMSVGQMLGVLVLATAAPLLALAFIMVQQLVRTERQSVRGELLSSMRTLSALVENEIGRHIAVAATLATSQALEKGDLETFRLQAEQALQIVPGAWLSLSDPSGRFVMTTLLDKGEHLPLRGNLDVMAKAWASGKPQVSDVVTGPISKRQNAFVEYPVFKGGEPLYSIVVGLNPDRFLNLLKDKFDQRAVVGVIDRHYKFIARIPDQEARVGTLASEGWRAALALAPQGIAEHKTLEGEMSLTAYFPTQDGWTAGISFPLEALDAPVRRALWLLALVGALLTLASLALGFGLARNFSRIMTELSGAAGKVGQGQIIAAQTFPIREASAISRTLSTSSRELARREASLSAVQATFRRLVENSPFGIYLVDADFRLMLVGAGAQKVFANVRPLLGRDLAEVLRSVWEEPFASEAIAIFRRTLETGEPYHSPNTVDRRHDIQKIESYDWKTERLALPDGRFGVVCYFYDLSERQHYEDALRASESRFRGTFENAAVGVAHIGLDGTWLRVNQRLCHILGYSREELSALNVQDITHAEDRGIELENMRRLLAGETQTYGVEKRFVRRDGSITWISITVALQRDLIGAPEYLISIIQDIAARKETQSHLDFLLRELAHRSKNQLTIVQAVASQTARRSLSLAEFLRDFEQRIQGLAIATDLLAAQKWNSASIVDLVNRQLEAFAPNAARLICDGAEISLSPDATEAIGIALNELATNCVKYGAWSNGVGAVNVRWRVEDSNELRLSWIESGGPLVKPPTRSGFGQLVIERMVAQKIGGQVELTFAPQGVSWTLRAPVAAFRQARSEGVPTLSEWRPASSFG